MGLSLLGALGAAVFFGVASVMQAVAARAADTGAAGVDPRLLVRLLGQWRFLAGVGLDLLGFAAELGALRGLPLFVVQAAVASSLAVTAVAASVVVGVRLDRREWLAVAAVCAGLALLGLSAGTQSAAGAGTAFRYALLGAVAVLAAAGTAAGRLPAAARTPLLGLLSGFCFGVVALAARVLVSLSPPALVRDPAAYALVAAGTAGFLFFTSALSRGGVTVATAGVVLGETVGPALVGLAVLGDRTRPGLAPLAVAGFVVAVAGALTLARFGDAPADTGQHPSPVVRGER
jgi:drug/metabolite transporter (DMT)-like permease